MWFLKYFNETTKKFLTIFKSLFYAYFKNVKEGIKGNILWKISELMEITLFKENR